MEQTPLPAPTIAPKRKGASAGSILLVVAALVAVAGVTFAVGRMTAPTTSGTGNRNFQGDGAFPRGSLVPGGSFVPGQGGMPGDALGGGSLTIEGTVSSVGGGKLTLKLTSGSTMEVATDSSTSYHRQGDASSSDVTVGSQVLVQVNGLRGMLGGRAGASAVPGAAASPNATPAPQAATDITVVAP